MPPKAPLWAELFPANFQNEKETQRGAPNGGMRDANNPIGAHTFEFRPSCKTTRGRRKPWGRRFLEAPSLSKRTAPGQLWENAFRPGGFYEESTATAQISPGPPKFYPVAPIDL